MNKILIITLLLFLKGEYLFSDTLIIKGIVIESETSLPLKNAEVQIPDLKEKFITKSDGLFEFVLQNAGEYKFEIMLEGYRPHSELINIQNDSVQFLLFKLVNEGYRTPVITITDDHPKSRFDDLLELSNVLKNKELQKNLGQTLAATLKDETGLSIRSMGPAPSRPVYRGLSGDRVFISEDGMKTADLSATSPDHAVTVEPFTIDRIEIIRGPKILLKSPSSIGGVINVVRNEIPLLLPSKLLLKTGGFYETSNKGFLASGVFELPVKKFDFRGEASFRKTSDMKTPEGILKNSDIETLNLSSGLSYFFNKGYAGISAREYKNDYGIPGGFVGAHPNGVDISMLKTQLNFKMNYNFNSEFFEHADGEFSRVFYKHSEFESPELIGAEFRIITYLGFLNLLHDRKGIFKNGISGVSFENRDFNIGGFVFTPPTKSFSLSVYANEELIKTGNWNFELSARYNYSNVSPQQSVQLANLDTVFRRTFNTFSLSASAVYEINDILNVGINLSRSSRVPTIEELYSDGPHLAAYSYEIGNPYLEDERGFGSELFVYLKNENLYAMLTGFFNEMSYYIIPRNTGEINFATLLPVYRTEGIGARIYGAESQIEYKFLKNLSADASLSYAYGEIKNFNSPLPQIPPLKVNIEVKYSDDKYSAGINSEIAAGQYRVDEFEQPTSGYVIFGAFGQASILSGKFLHSFTLNLENLTNRIYRNHLSRIKSIVPEPGINLRLLYKLYF